MALPLRLSAFEGGLHAFILGNGTPRANYSGLAVAMEVRISVSAWIFRNL